MLSQIIKGKKRKSFTKKIPFHSSYKVLESLVDGGFLSNEAQQIIIQDCHKTELNPISFMLDSNLIEIKDFVGFLLLNLNIDSIDLLTTPLDNSLITKEKFSAWVKLDAFPFALNGDVLSVVMDIPFDNDVVLSVYELTDFRYTIKPFFSIHLTVKEAIDLCYNRQEKVQQIMDISTTYLLDENNFDLQNQSNIIKLVESLLLEALNFKASDLHFDQGKFFVSQRLRIDGVLVEKRKISLWLWSSIRIRLKIMANVDITENQIPQDGSFFARLMGKEYDFRFSCIPSFFGESIVIRSASEKNIFSLEELGLPTDTTQSLRKVIKQPSGLILVGGPTGSGKTTTLYALLKELPLTEINVASLEDPVEHILPGVRQTSIKPEVGMSFATGIRTLLRQDPDVLLIGEIRDSETAQLAVKASLSGHLVLASVHADAILDIPNRIQNLLTSNEPFMEQVIALMSQRLIRTFCQNCNGTGCQTCLETGYKGRFIVLELLHLKKGLFSQPICQHNYLTIQDYSLQAVKNGITDNKEINRILGEM